MELHFFSLPLAVLTKGAEDMLLLLLFVMELLLLLLEAEVAEAVELVAEAVPVATGPRDEAAEEGATEAADISQEKNISSERKGKR